MNILLIALGGFIGSVARFYISVKTNKRLIGTLIANVTGSILLASILHFHLTDTISKSLWLFAGTGFCGAYTTFSTFGNETLQLILEKNYRAAVIYVACSLCISLFFVLGIVSIM